MDTSGIVVHPLTVWRSLVWAAFAQAKKAFFWRGNKAKLTAGVLARQVKNQKTQI